MKFPKIRNRILTNRISPTLRRTDRIRKPEKKRNILKIDNRVLRKGRIPNKKQSKIRKKTRMPKTARNRIILAKNIRKLLTNRIKNSQKRKNNQKMKQFLPNSVGK